VCSEGPEGPDGGRAYLGSIFAAKVWTAILPKRTTRVSVPIGTSADAHVACHTMKATSPSTCSASRVNW